MKNVKFLVYEKIWVKDMKSKIRWSKICETTTQNIFFRSKGPGSGYTIALSGMRPYLYYVYCQTPPPLPCAVTIHKTCMDQQWNGFQNSVHIQYQRSMYWQYTKHFDLSPWAGKQYNTQYLWYQQCRRQILTTNIFFPVDVYINSGVMYTCVMFCKLSILWVWQTIKFS